jgi:hypothetical protein
MAVSLKENNCFKPKIPIFGKFWRVLKWKMLVYYMVIWSILRLFGVFCGHLVYFMFLVYFLPYWYVVPRKIWQPCHSRGTRGQGEDYRDFRIANGSSKSAIDDAGHLRFLYNGVNCIGAPFI